MIGNSNHSTSKVVGFERNGETAKTNAFAFTVYNFQQGAHIH